MSYHPLTTVSTLLRLRTTTERLDSAKVRAVFRKSEYRPVLDRESTKHRRYRRFLTYIKSLI